MENGKKRKKKKKKDKRKIKQSIVLLKEPEFKSQLVETLTSHLYG